MIESDLKPGDIVQLSPESVGRKAFAGCFMVVTKVKKWGAQGYIQPVGERLDAPAFGVCFYRARWEEMEPTGGTAMWMAA